MRIGALTDSLKNLKTRIDRIDKDVRSSVAGYRNAYGKIFPFTENQLGLGASRQEYWQFSGDVHRELAIENKELTQIQSRDEYKKLHHQIKVTQEILSKAFGIWGSYKIAMIHRMNESVCKLGKTWSAYDIFYRWKYNVHMSKAEACKKAAESLSTLSGQCMRDIELIPMPQFQDLQSLPPLQMDSMPSPSNVASNNTSSGKTHRNGSSKFSAPPRLHYVYNQAAMARVLLASLKYPPGTFSLYDMTSHQYFDGHSKAKVKRKQKPKYSPPAKLPSRKELKAGLIKILQAFKKDRSKRPNLEKTMLKIEAVESKKHPTQAQYDARQRKFDEIIKEEKELLKDFNGSNDEKMQAVVDDLILGPLNHYVAANSRLSDCLDGKGCNCVGESLLVSSVFQKLGLKPDPDEKFALQTFDRHLQPVLLKKNGTVHAFIDGSNIKGIVSDLYDPMDTIDAFFTKRHIHVPDVSISDFLVAKRNIKKPNVVLKELQKHLHNKGGIALRTDSPLLFPKDGIRYSQKAPPKEATLSIPTNSTVLNILGQVISGETAAIDGNGISRSDIVWIKSGKLSDGTPVGLAEKNIPILGNKPYIFTRKSDFIHAMNLGSDAARKKFFDEMQKKGNEMLLKSRAFKGAMQAIGSMNAFEKANLKELKDVGDLMHHSFYFIGTDVNDALVAAGRKCMAFVRKNPTAFLRTIVKFDKKTGGEHSAISAFEVISYLTKDKSFDRAIVPMLADKNEVDFSVATHLQKKVLKKDESFEVPLDASKTFQSDKHSSPKKPISADLANDVFVKKSKAKITVSVKEFLALMTAMGDPSNNIYRRWTPLFSAILRLTLSPCDLRFSLFGSGIGSEVLTNVRLQRTDKLNWHLHTLKRGGWTMPQHIPDDIYALYKYWATGCPKH